MTNFNTNYIRLLREQVEVELKYLKSVGHTHDLMDEPCIFCFEARRPAGDSRTNGEFANKYRCNRLKELENFLSQLVVREGTQGGKSGSKSIPQYHYNTNTIRLPIGEPVGIHKTQVNEFNHHYPVDKPHITNGDLYPLMPINVKF